MQLKPCESCGGARLKKESLWFKIDDRNISELSDLNLDNLAAWLDGIELRIDNKQKVIAKDVLKEIRERLQFTAPLPDDLEAVIAELVPPDQIDKVFAREPVDDHDE